jgi:hypothetical protein
MAKKRLDRMANARATICVGPAGWAMQREIRVLDPDQDRTHDGRGDPAFQESSVIVWHDLASGVGGVWRISQEPQNKLARSCFAVFATDGARFRQNIEPAPMGPGDRGPSHMSLGEALWLDLAAMTVEARFPECQAKLAFKDFHPRYDYFDLMDLRPPHGGDDGHVEVSGSLTGTVTIGGRDYRVNALAHRARAWGPRRWGALLSTRWWPIVFGPDLSIGLQSAVTRNGGRDCRGYVMRDGVPTPLAAADIAMRLEHDTAGPKAGQARLALDGGQAFEARHQRTSEVFLDIEGVLAIQSIGVAEFAGRRGMSSVEVCAHPFGGEGIPGVVLEADGSQGFVRADA